jgi:hypothetical protein
MCEDTKNIIKYKARLITAATAALGLAVIVTVIAGIVAK